MVRDQFPEGCSVAFRFRRQGPVGNPEFREQSRPPVRMANEVQALSLLRPWPYGHCRHHAEHECQTPCKQLPCEFLQKVETVAPRFTVGRDPPRISLQFSSIY